MVCQKCGTQNLENSKFCIKCGTNMSSETMTNTVSNLQPNMNTMNSQPSYNDLNSTQTQSINDQQPPSVNSNTHIPSMSISSCFFFILAVILKPFTAFKEELSKLDSFKNSAIIALIVSIFATIASLVKTMLNVVMVKSFSWSGGHTTTWEWKNLKEINYIQVVGKSFLIYIGIIATIAIVYYIASLIVKKQKSFSRLLGISATSVVPMLVCTLILSPLFAMIYAPLGMGITIVGGVYTIVIVYEQMNKEITLEGNAKYYFNFVCLSILSIIAYYLCMKVLMSSISGSINNILNMFK